MYVLDSSLDESSAMPVPQGGNVPTVNDAFWMPGLIKRLFPTRLIAGVQSLKVIDKLAGVSWGRTDSLVVVHACIIPDRTPPDAIATPWDARSAIGEARELAGGTIDASDRRHRDNVNAAAHAVPPMIVKSVVVKSDCSHRDDDDARRSQTPSGEWGRKGDRWPRLSWWRRG
jgi:hypothetical protein